MGDNYIEVEIDEIELGRKPNGPHGYKKDMKSDILEIFDKSSGLSWKLMIKSSLEKTLKKWFGPLRYRYRYGRDGQAVHCPWLHLIFTGGAKAYDKLAKEKGWTHAYVDHQEGESVRYQRIRAH